MPLLTRVKRSPVQRPIASTKKSNKTDSQVKTNEGHNSALSQPGQSVSGQPKTIVREPFRPGFYKSHDDDFLKICDATVPLIQKVQQSAPQTIPSKPQVGMRRAVTRPGKRPQPTPTVQTALKHSESKSLTPNFGNVVNSE